MLTCLDPRHYVIFSKPPLSARNNQMQELLITEYAPWVVQSNNNNIFQGTVSVPSPSTDLKVTEDSVIEEWASFSPDEWDSTEEPMPASNPVSQSLHPILSQIKEYWN